MSIQHSTSIITIGNFDGVHLAHQAIIKSARELAGKNSKPTGNIKVIALCFDPHPISILRPGTQPPQICDAPEKVAKLKQAGADEVVILKPDKNILGKAPEQFIEYLVNKYHPIAFVEGADFHFGKGRSGDMDSLKQLGGKYGFDAITQPPVEVTLNDKNIAPVSSSLVRWLVGRGRVEDALTCLGRYFSLSAPVIGGEQQGRKLGVPTANLSLEICRRFIIPTDGVYAGYARIEGEKDNYIAAISIGVKPTFGKKKLTIEAHLLDFSGDIYGKTISIEFARFLRDQFTFPDIESLKKQINRDIEQTRYCLGRD